MPSCPQDAATASSPSSLPLCAELRSVVAGHVEAVAAAAAEGVARQQVGCDGVGGGVPGAHVHTSVQPLKIVRLHLAPHHYT